MGAPDGGEGSVGERAGTIQAVARAMRLLGLFSPQRPDWSVAELARETGLHKSVVTRMMATMAAAGFVVQDPVGRGYGVGPRAFAVGAGYRPHAVLTQIAGPVMRELTERRGHATSLGVPAGERFVYLLVHESRHPVRVAAGTGEFRDYHANAIGKVLLAALADDEVRLLVGPEPLPERTPATVTAIEPLLAELADVRGSGIAHNRQEAVVGVGAVAATIDEGGGRRVAGLSIVYPSHLVDEAEEAELIEAVRDAAALISARLSR